MVFKKEDKAWNKGISVRTNSGKTHFKKGHNPWNKGMKGKYKNPIRGILNKLNPPHLGHKHSDKSKTKMSEILKRQFKNGRINYNKGKHLSIETRNKISKSKKRLPELLSKKCLVCKKIFKPRTNKHKLCSIICFGIWNSGENNCLWKGGKSFEIYPKNWRKIRNIIRERDKYTCKICGIKQEYLKHKLCVHHLDENKQNISKENLISFCRQCHTKIHRRKK